MEIVVLCGYQIRYQNFALVFDSMSGKCVAGAIVGVAPKVIGGGPMY